MPAANGHFFPSHMGVVGYAVKKDKGIAMSLDALQAVIARVRADLRRSRFQTDGGASRMLRSGCLALSLLALAQLGQAEDAVPAPAVVAPAAEVPAPAPAPAAEAPAAVPPAAEVPVAPAAEVPAAVTPAAVVPAPAPAADVPAVEAPAAAPSAADAPAAATPARLAIPVHGFVKTSFRGRYAPDQSDNDLHVSLALDVGEAERNRVTAHVQGDVSLDLDGDASTVGFNPFDSVRDSKGENGVALLYAAYLDVHRTGPLDILRLGRQSIQETPEVAFFDGLRLESEDLGRFQVRLGAYGGVAVRLFEAQTTDGLLGGTYVKSRLWKGARARLDWLHLQDGREGGRESDLLGADAWQSLAGCVDLHGHATTLDGQARDVRGRATLTPPGWDLMVQATYYQLLEIQRDAVLEADSFVPLLGIQVPYAEGRLLVSKDFGEEAVIDLGVDVRRLTEQEQTQPFNHEFERYYGSITVFDVAVKGSSLSLTGEYWQSDLSDTTSGGLDATCPVGKSGKVSVGTAHYIYKYDPVTGSERDDIQTYYIKARYKRNHSSKPLTPLTQV